MTRFTLVIIDTCGWLRIRVLVIEPIIISRFQSGVVGMARYTPVIRKWVCAEIKVDITHKWFDGFGTLSRANSFIVGSIPYNWLR